MQGLGRVDACDFTRNVRDEKEEGEATIDDGAERREPAEFVPPTSQREVAALCDGVIDLMAALFSVSGRQLRSPRREGKSVSRVRQIGMYIAHTTLGLRMVEVASGFGRDKSTVMYACHLVEDLRDEVEFDQIVARAERVVRVAFNLQAREGIDER